MPDTTPTLLLVLLVGQAVVAVRLCASHTATPHTQLLA